MKTKTLILLFFLVSSFAFAQNNEWLIYNQDNTALPSNTVKAISFDNGSAWIGTVIGLAINTDGAWNVYNTSNSSLSNDYVHSIAIDNFGTKWIGTGNGLVSINGSPSERGWIIYNSNNSGLPLNDVTAVAIDNNNKKWFGTWGGGVSSFFNGVWETFNMYNSALPSNGIYDLKIDNNNNVWIATHGGGLVKFNGIDWIVYNKENSGISSNYIYTIDFDNQSNVWIGTEVGLVKFNGAFSWTLYDISNTGWDFTAVMCVKVERNTQNIYFGTYNGLGIVKNGAFQFKKTTNSALSHNWVSAINIDEDGNKWIGTLGGGISIYNEYGVTLSNKEISNKLDLQLFSAYPNPAYDIVNIKFNVCNTDRVFLKIYDLTGKIVCEKEFFELDNETKLLTFSVSQLPSGLYYYSLKTATDVKTSKFTKI